MVERMTLAFRTLPPAFDGVTVAVLSDLHAGLRLGGARAVREIVEQLRRDNRRKPAFIDEMKAL